MCGAAILNNYRKKIWGKFISPNNAANFKFSEKKIFFVQVFVIWISWLRTEITDIQVKRTTSKEFDSYRLINLFHSFLQILAKQFKQQAFFFYWKCVSFYPGLLYAENFVYRSINLWINLIHVINNE